MRLYLENPNLFPNMLLSDRYLKVWGALFGFLGVALGAFGAHVLEGRLAAPDLATFEVAVRYMVYHALALLIVAGPAGKLRSATLAGNAFFIGIVVFSGSLFLLLGTGFRWLGAVTPLGGVAFLVGWLALAWGYLKK